MGMLAAWIFFEPQAYSPEQDGGSPGAGVYRWLRAAVWVLGTMAGFSERTACALNH